MSITGKISDASRILFALGMDQERSNERSALTLLALLRLRPDDSWSDAANPMLGTRAIMDWMRDNYDRDYAANTRETIWRFTLHQFVDALLVQQNPDQPGRPVNSPKWNYQVTTEALGVIRRYGTERFDTALTDYLARIPGLRAQYAAARELNRIPVILPDGTPFSLSPGGQNILIKQVLDDFCPRFTPGAEVLYVGDADSKWALFEAGRLAELGVPVDEHGKMPDLVTYLPDRNWLVLMEAASGRQEAMTETIDRAVLDGQAVYNRFVLACYDLAVLHGTAPLLWGCTVGDLLGLYHASVGAEHLEIGVGTGYLPARTRFPVDDPRITLLDLNPTALAFTAHRLRAYRPATVRANVLEPFPLPSGRFDSVALNFLLHCVPGSIPEKGVVFAHAARVAKPGGVVFGSTILSSGLPVPLRARLGMRLMNRTGTFHNDRDDLADLDTELGRRFDRHRIVVRGCTALFRARVG